MTERTRVRRKAERGAYDQATIRAILDEAICCHVGFAIDGAPCVIPMVHARVGEQLYVHGATGNHMLRTLASAPPVCVTITLFDGLVLSRSWFHHSVNYRSVVIFGTAAVVDDPEEKLHALRAVVEHLVPGRADDARPPTPAELRATSVVRVPIDEASAKVRVGGPIEDPADEDVACWAGELPLRVSAAAPIPDAVVPLLVEHPPRYITEWAR